MRGGRPVAAQPCRGGAAGGGAPSRGGRGEAASALERWRDGRSPDAGGKLSAAAYRALFRLSPAAYDASGHWRRRAKAQLAAAPACEVERCEAPDASAQHLTHATLGEEQPGRDLITLCDGCHRRAEKLGRELGRLPRRERDRPARPAGPLYEPDEIAALKAKYAPPALRSRREEEWGVAATPTASEGARHGQLRHGPRNSLVPTSSASRTAA